MELGSFPGPYRNLVDGVLIESQSGFQLVGPRVDLFRRRPQLATPGEKDRLRLLHAVVLHAQALSLFTAERGRHDATWVAIAPRCVPMPLPAEERGLVGPFRAIARRRRFYASVEGSCPGEPILSPSIS